MYTFDLPETDDDTKKKIRRQLQVSLAENNKYISIREVINGVQYNRQIMLRIEAILDCPEKPQDTRQFVMAFQAAELMQVHLANFIDEYLALDKR